MRSLRKPGNQEVRRSLSPAFLVSLDSCYCIWLKCYPKKILSNNTIDDKSSVWNWMQLFLVAKLRLRNGLSRSSRFTKHSIHDPPQQPPQNTLFASSTVPPFSVSHESVTITETLRPCAVIVASLFIEVDYHLHFYGKLVSWLIKMLSVLDQISTSASQQNCSFQIDNSRRKVFECL